MNKTVKIKKFGARSTKTITMKLPDHVTCLDKYDIDIVEYDLIGRPEAAIFITQNNEEINGITIPLGMKDSFKYGMKLLIEKMNSTLNVAVTG